MAEMSIDAWKFRVTSHDMVLILSALGGRLNNNQIEEAKALGDKLTAIRIKEMEDATERLRNSLSG